MGFDKATEAQLLAQRAIAEQQAKLARQAMELPRRPSSIVPRPPHDAVAALLGFSADYEQTTEDAEKELCDAGVDVDGFVARLNARLAKQADEASCQELQDENTKLKARVCELERRYIR